MYNFTVTSVRVIFFLLIAGNINSLSNVVCQGNGVCRYC